MCDCVIIMQADRVDGHTPQHSNQLPGLTTFQTEFCSQSPEREREKGGREEERKKETGKREKMFESALSMFKGKPASWAEIANVKHLLQLMFNP